MIASPTLELEALHPNAQCIVEQEREIRRLGMREGELVTLPADVEPQRVNSKASRAAEA